MKKLRILSLFMSTVLSLGALAQGPIEESGNLSSVIRDVSVLTPESAVLASELESVQSFNPECPSEGQKLDEEKDSQKPSALSHSPINSDEGKVKRIDFFFDYEQILGGQNGEMSFQSAAIPYIPIPFAIRSFAISNGVSISSVLSKSDSELENIYKDFALHRGVDPTQADQLARSALIITRMSQFGSSDEAMDFAAGELSNATKDQKVSFLANYMGALADNYEDDMIGGGPTQWESRVDDDLHQALSDSINTGAVTPSGVCRHMHAMGVRLARKLGFNEAFGVGFRTAGAGHRTMVITDPNSPTEVVQLNYNRVSTNNGVSGVGALSQNGTIPDAGLRFRIYNAEDKMAIIVPSELGGVLNRVTGGDDSDLGQRFEDDSQIMQTGIKTRFGNVRVFRATNPLGNQALTSGVSYDGRANFGKSIYLETGVAGFSTERPSQRGALRANGFYGRLTFGFDKKLIDKEKFSLRAYGEAHPRFMVFNASIQSSSPSISVPENEEETNSDLNLDSQVGVSADYKIGDVWSRTSLTSQLVVGEDHATNLSRPALIAPTHTFDHDSYISLGTDTTLNAGLGLTMYNLGTGTYGTYESNLGVESARTKTSANLEFEGRLTKDTPFWLPGAEHAASLSIDQGIFDNRLYIGVDGRQSLDLLENRYIGLRVGGRFGSRK